MITRFVRPFASKAASLSFAQARTGLFSAPLARKFSKINEVDKAEKKLQKLISQELEFEEDNYAEDQPIQQYLTENKWVMEDKETSNLLLLKKISANSVVQIYFTSKSPSFNGEDGEEPEEGDQAPKKTAEQEEEERDSMQDQEFTEFNVYITRGKQTVAFECVSVNGEIEVNHCNVIDDINIHRTQSPFNMTAVDSYKGPEFVTLDEGVQQALMELLSAHGVNEDLAQIIERAALDKEQRLYMRWLGQVREFLKSK